MNRATKKTLLDIRENDDKKTLLDICGNDDKEDITGHT